MRKVLGCCLVALGLSGCTRNGIQITVDSQPPPSDTSDAPHRSAFLLDTAAESVQEARSEAETIRRDAPANAKENLTDLVDLLDDAGASLAEYNAKTLATPAQRTKAISCANDALKSLEDAKGIAQGLADVAPSAAKAKLEGVATLVNDGMDATSQAVIELGGKVLATDQDIAPPR